MRCGRSRGGDGGVHRSATPLAAASPTATSSRSWLFVMIGLVATVHQRPGDRIGSRRIRNSCRAAAAQQPPASTTSSDLTERVEAQPTRRSAPSCSKPSCGHEIDILEDIERSLSTGTRTQTLPAVGAQTPTWPSSTPVRTPASTRRSPTSPTPRRSWPTSRPPGTDEATRTRQVNVLQRDRSAATADLLDKSVQLYADQARDHRSTTNARPARRCC